MKSMDAEELKKTLDVNERMVREKSNKSVLKKDYRWQNSANYLAAKDRQFSNMKKGSSRHKVLYWVDKEDPWEHLVVFYNDITLSDGLENKKLEPVEILKRLADCGLFEFEEEEITE